MNWYRNNWYYVGGGIFVVLAIVMSLFGELIDPVRRIMIVGYMGLLIHQFEEYVLPGGFPMVWNIVQSGEREIYNRYPMNKNNKPRQTMKKVFFVYVVLFALAATTGCKSGTIDNEYEDTTLYLCCEESNPSNLSLVRKQGKYAFQLMDESDSIINNQWFDDAHHYSHGLWAVKLNEKWGFVDTTGNIVIPIIFDSVHVFEENGGEVFSEYGLGYVYLKSTGWICIDTTGAEVPEI